MRFLIDAQLPPMLASALSAEGHASETVRSLGLRDAEDEVIWEYAKAHLFVIITKDEDFASRVWRTDEGPSVIWLRMGNCSNQSLLARLLPLLPDVIERIELGDRLVEVS